MTTLYGKPIPTLINRKWQWNKYSENKDILLKFSYTELPVKASAGFFCFLLCHIVCGILVPQPGIEPMTPAVEAQNLSHWVSHCIYFIVCFRFWCSVIQDTGVSGFVFFFGILRKNVFSAKCLFPLGSPGLDLPPCFLAWSSVPHLYMFAW